MLARESANNLLILIPVYNDWSSVALLLTKIDEVLARDEMPAEVMLIDDGSTAECPVRQFADDYRAVHRVDVLALRRNLGHQRALCIGLSYLAHVNRPGRVVVMDGDGEDDPQDISRLLTKLDAEGGGCIVFAERTRRCESVVFRFFYEVYRWLHWLLVGHRVRVGNFSVIPAERLASIAVVPELWNHYAAAVFASRQPFCSIPTERCERLSGESKMNFIGLVIHGMGALAVFSDRIGVRLLLSVSVLIVLVMLGIVGVLTVRLTTDVPVPGWATYSIGLLVVVLLQLFGLLATFSFVILSGRTSGTFLPARDFQYFIDRVKTVFQASESS